MQSLRGRNRRHASLLRLVEGRVRSWCRNRFSWGSGIAAGATLVAGLVLISSGGTMTVKQLGGVAGYATLMVAVSLPACVVPTRRALRVEPTEALRTDA